MSDTQSLVSLLNSSEGLDFLETRGVLTDLNRFNKLLQPPVRSDLAAGFGVDSKTKIICSGQQVCVDFQHSVLSKIELLQQMSGDAELFPFFLWVDTDRAGSDNLMTKFAWPGPSKKGPITILPPGTRDVEARFAQTDPSQLSSAIGRLETHLRQIGKQNEAGAIDRFLRFKAHFVDQQPAPLSTFNLRLADFMLTDVLGFSPRSAVISQQLDKEFLMEQVDLFLNHLVEIVSVFNAARSFLLAKGIDPQVNPLEPDYLPLFYSCDDDGRRLRLHHYIDGKDHFACCACKCGRRFQFHLGRDSLSTASFASTGRWSPDVCFPMFFNDQVSGFVAGKSSAIYLLILNEVLCEVFKKKPVPILVPAALAGRGGGGDDVDSLIYRYFAK